MPPAPNKNHRNGVSPLVIYLSNKIHAMTADTAIHPT